MIAVDFYPLKIYLKYHYVHSFNEKPAHFHERAVLFKLTLHIKMSAAHHLTFILMVSFKVPRLFPCRASSVPGFSFGVQTITVLGARGSQPSCLCFPFRSHRGFILYLEAARPDSLRVYLLSRYALIP